MTEETEKQDYVMVRVTPDFKKRLEKLAERLDLAMSAIVKLAVEDFAKKYPEG